MKQKKQFFFVVFFYLFFSGLYGQENENPLQAQTGGSSDASPAVYYIRTVRFDHQGRSTQRALMEKGEFVLGEKITGEKNFEEYIARKTQLLVNQRVLEEVYIEYTPGTAEKDGLVPVDLAVRTVDTRNFIILPEPKYDSNSGLELTFKVRDYNFLGSMTPLRIDLGYLYNEKAQQGVLLEIDSDVPFQAFGYSWNLNFDNDFNYTQGSPLYYKNTTGLSLDLPVKKTTLTFGFDQSLLVNEENNTSDAIDDGPYFRDHWYMASELYAQWKIPLGLAVGSLGALTYTPKLTGTIKYRPNGELGEYRKGPAVTPSHTLGFGDINWKGNYRSGLEVSLTNSSTYNAGRTSWDNTISFSAIGHLPVSEDLGISGRLMYQHWFFDANSIPLAYGSEYFHVYSDGGDVLRGIKNNRLPAKYMLSLNMDFPVRLFRFVPSEWFRNPRFHFFDFEVHGSPFIDIALVRDPVHNISFSPKNIQAAGGLEVIVFPLAMRSLYLRLSLGTELRELVKTGRFFPSGNRELFIGVGHFY